MPPSQPSSGAGLRCRLLVVEDSPTQGYRLQQLLEANDYEVESVTSGPAALESLSARLPDVVLSDVVMPDMDGYALCRRIKSEYPDLPVVLVTSLSGPESILEGLDCGANSFVVKPYDPEMLLARLRYVLVNDAIRRRGATELGLDVFVAGRRHFVGADRMQILDLLFSTFDAVSQRSQELERTNQELHAALDTMRELAQLLLPCSECGRLRDFEGSLERIAALLDERGWLEPGEMRCQRCSVRVVGSEEPR